MSSRSRVSPNIIAGGLLVALVVLFILALQWARQLTPTGQVYPWNPLALVVMMLKGTMVWPSATIPLFLVMLTALVGVYVAAMLALMKVRRRRSGRGDDQVQTHLATREQTAVLRDRARREEADRMHPEAPDLPAGQKLGMTLLERPAAWLLQGWRDLGVFIFGTGRGKTSAMVIRRVIEAPGAAGMTSNKVDGVAEVIAGRRGRGETWIFDPNGIFRHDATAPDFVINPLRSVRGSADAKELAAILESSTKTSSDRGGDAQFDTDGRDLLAYFLLAAALEELPIGTVYGWVTGMAGERVVKILSAHGKNGPAAMIRGVELLSDRTRTSVYATARRMAACLADDELLAWTAAEGVREFDPTTFHGTTDLIVLLSKDGEGSASALLTMLVRAICKSAEKAAQRNGGRLRVPLVLELDECANTVRWPELPSLYSYYGSMAIILDCYFQSRAQGIRAFGREGWQTLWDAASTRGFGGGSGDDEFLQSLSRLIGDHDEEVRSLSEGGDGRTSTSTNTRKVATFDVAALGGLPEWRAVILSSKAPATMIELKPWFTDQALVALITAPSTTQGDPR